MALLVSISVQDCAGFMSDHGLGLGLGLIIIRMIMCCESCHEPPMSHDSSYLCRRSGSHMGQL